MATYVLIPGGGGDPWEWHRLVPELEARGHEAIAIRLPAEDETASWPEYADAVAQAVGDRGGLVVVASSMGGFTAPMVCTRRPVDLLVLLNAMIPVTGETFNAWWTNTGSGPARREYHASIGLTPGAAEADAVIYYHDLSAELRAEAEARTWQDQSATPLDDPWPLPTWPHIPTRVLAGRHDRMFPLLFQRRVARERLDLEVDELDGGHMVALSNPGALADRLEAYRRDVQDEQRGAREPTRMTTYLILLRGINVGGKNRLSMARLRQLLEELGYSEVSTYIASGNVILKSDKPSREIKAQIEEALPGTFKLDSELIAVLVLTRDQLQAVIDNKPEGFGDQPETSHSDAIFLMGIDSAQAMAVFDPREGVDEVWPGKGVIYSQRLSAQRTRSRLSKVMGTPAYKSMTIRSWNTVATLLEMLQKGEAVRAAPASQS